MRWGRSTYIKDENFYEGKKKLNKAFTLLRQEKLIARQNFSCCMGCGCAEIDGMAVEQNKKEKKYPRGYVFFHRQDTDSLDDSGKVYIRYGTFENRNGKIRKGCLTGTEVGKLVVEKMKEVGLNTEWNGSEYTCVLVDVDGSGFEEN